MSEWKPKRFWKKVDVVSLEKGFCIKLDTKILKTPAKKEMLLPTNALAKKIAAGGVQKFVAIKSKIVKM